MNKNIEVISDTIWAVNFDYVREGWIDEINLNKTKTDELICLLDSGIILINKRDSNYKDIAFWVSHIAKLPDKDLGTKKGYFDFIRNLYPSVKHFTDIQLKALISRNDLEGHKNTYRASCYIEKKRRSLWKAAKKKQMKRV